ncbi:MAG TPA: C40 family peptidase [Mycobacteriales bacterium]|jgi:cell wall-associated NlpC family hydrolase|nr:C40 family peptidase [Mycobacteriales bacterium]
MAATRRWASIAVAAGLALSATVIGPSAATADTIADARAKAAQLAAQITALQDKAEVAAERYDKVESQLLQANAAQIEADQQLDAIQQRAAAAAQEVSSRTRALYESGGDPVVLAAMLGGQDPIDAMDRYHLASAVIHYEARSAAAAADTVATAQALDAKDAAISANVLQLEKAASRASAKVNELITAARNELRHTNATLRALVRNAQLATLLQGAADFKSAVEAAGGTVGSGPGQPPNQTVAAAIQWARSRLGDPYVWGGSGPSVFDCSGLVQWSYAHAGITLPRVAADQYNAGPHPSLADLEPGDLLFWATDLSNPATIHHVTMYLGGGLMIAAPHTGTVVQIQNVYMPGFIGATRPWK